ncbi:ketosteroid isomerase-related protein [uncultured Tateyamaria sp.]|uniref:ketosteroid isomerase-related protein n=1 Tax=Tateyamaria sp. 1078 TaxID=3417464 RepID=UPI002622D23E|nr:ketosteroid isomerase-related protein [uncultured Tateyamaria sp.]
MTVVAQYFEAFNAGDVDGMLACLTEDVAHHVNEGQIRRGREAFATFCRHMSRCYAEELRDMVVFVHPDGTRAAAEYAVHGTYLATDGDLPAAHGQRYVLPAGSFFDLRDGRISRVTTYYNLADWLRQVTA